MPYKAWVGVKNYRLKGGITALVHVWKEGSANMKTLLLLSLCTDKSLSKIFHAALSSCHECVIKLALRDSGLELNSSVMPNMSFTGTI